MQAASNSETSEQTRYTTYSKNPEDYCQQRPPSKRRNLIYGLVIAMIWQRVYSCLCQRNVGNERMCKTNIANN